jgi:hypothetical protein
METLARHNSPLIMSQCGSKGSAINIAQVRVRMRIWNVVHGPTKTPAMK